MNRECWGDATSLGDSLDVVMELLTSRRRCHVLDYLIRESGGVTYDPSRRRVRYLGSSLLEDLLDAEIRERTAR